MELRYFDFMNNLFNRMLFHMIPFKRELDRSGLSTFPYTGEMGKRNNIHRQLCVDFPYGT